MSRDGRCQMNAQGLFSKGRDKCGIKSNSPD